MALLTHLQHTDPPLPQEDGDADVVSDRTGEAPSLAALHEAVQHVIRVASMPPSFQNEFATMSTRRLLEKASGGFTQDRNGTSNRSRSRHESTVTFASPLPASEPAVDAPGTVLMCQKRLNAEYRHLASQLREEHEKRLSEVRESFLVKERSVRSRHMESMKRIAAMTVDAQEVVLPHVKAPSTVAVEVLEQKLAASVAQDESRTSRTSDNSETSSSLTAIDASTKKVVAFWKAKYHTLAKKLETTMAEIAAAEAQCSQQVELRGANRNTLEQMFLTLRDAEYREKTRCDELCVQYHEECRRRRVPPKEIETDDVVAMRYDPTTGHLVEAATVGTEPGSPATAGNAAQLLSSLIREQQRKNREMRMTSDQVESRMRKLMSDYDQALETFAVKSGTNHSAGSSVQLLEEVIALLTETDEAERGLFEQELQALKDAAKHLESMRGAVESYERERISLRREVGRRREELRELEVQLLCVSHAGGISRDVSSLEDEAHVLTSKIAMLENEIRIIRQEHDASVKVQRDLAERVGSNVLRLERAQ